MNISNEFPDYEVSRESFKEWVENPYEWEESDHPPDGDRFRAMYDALIACKMPYSRLAASCANARVQRTQNADIIIEGEMVIFVRQPRAE